MKNHDNEQAALAMVVRHEGARRRAAVIVATLLLTGCAWTHDSIPSAPIRFAESDYELGPETTGYACRGYAFGIAWGALFGRDTQWTAGSGVLGLLTNDRVTPEAKEAMFTALERADDATHLVAPRIRNTFGGFGTVGFPLFGKRCGEVWARTAVIGPPVQRSLIHQADARAAERQKAVKERAEQAETAATRDGRGLAEGLERAAREQSSTKFPAMDQAN